MPVEQFSNNASSTLNGAITNVATTLVVTSAALFPVAVAGVSQFRVIIEAEILIVTNTAGNTWTATRGAEGSTAAGHATSIAVVHILTSGSLGVTRGGADDVVTVSASGAAQTLTLPANTLGTFDIVLSTNCTLTLAGAVATKGSTMTVLLRQDGTGSRTVTWPASVVWAAGTAPVLSTAAGRVDIISLLSVNGGTVWFGAVAAAGYAAPIAPTAPTSLTANPGNTLVSLNWIAPANASPAVTAYKVYRSTSTGTETILVTLGNVTTYTDTAVLNGTAYFYKVTAVNAVGEGALSNEATTTPAAATGLPTTTTAATLWFKADALALANNAAVATWTDSSTTPANATQATGTKQPLFITGVVAGLPVVRFDGVDDTMSTARNWTPGYTAFAVMRQSATGVDHTLFSGAANTNATRVDATNHLAMLKTNVAIMATTVGTTPNPTTAFHVLAFSVAPGDGSSLRAIKMTIDGALETFSSANYATALPIAIGANDPGGTPGAFMKGDIAEMLYYPLDLSDVDRRAVEAYLGSKYGITVV